MSGIGKPEPEPEAASRVTMSLRQRHIKKGFRSGDAVTEGGAAAGGVRSDSAQALATVAVGLKPGEMQKLERQLFGSRLKDYLKSRYGYRRKPSALLQIAELHHLGR